MEPDYEQMQMEAARLGIEAEAFLSSNLGRYLMERADLEIDKLTQELINLDPTNIADNTRVRNGIRVCYDFKDWLAEAVNSGRVAHRNILESEAIDQ